jgi:hypothetical protein
LKLQVNADLALEEKYANSKSETTRQVDVWARLRGYLWSVLVVLFRYAVGVVTYRTRVSQRTGIRGPQILSVPKKFLVHLNF